MRALFQQRDFKQTQILKDLYSNSNSFSKHCSLLDDIRDQYISLDLRPLLYTPDFSILTLTKLLLLQSRIIIYSQHADKVSQYIYSILGLFPGMLTFDFNYKSAKLLG